MGKRYAPLDPGKSRTSKCPTELALALEVFKEKGYLHTVLVPFNKSSRKRNNYVQLFSNGPGVSRGND